MKPFRPLRAVSRLALASLVAVTTFGTARGAPTAPDVGDPIARIKRHPSVQRLRRAQARRRFLSTAGFAQHFGSYRDFAEARTTLPASPEFDLESLAGEYLAHRTTQVFPYDYPVIYWLTKIFDAGDHHVHDIGGSVGVHYFAYQRYLPRPPGLRWQVAEVPAIVRVGREYAASRGDTTVTFTDSVDPTHVDARVWLSSGALQYVESAGSLGDWLRRCLRPPNHVLLNKLPLHPDEQFVTTQNIGDGAFAPLHVYQRERFVADIVAAGYVLVDEWEVPERTFRLLDDPDRAFPYTGLYFRKA